MKNKKVVVVGGGLGALSAAIYLAKLGFSVLLFEKNEKVGGKVNEVVLDNYRFDTGASLLTMLSVIDDLFTFAGVTRSDYLDFLPIDPLCRYFFADGSVMDASADITKMKQAIEKISPEDVGAYERFLSYSERIYNLTSEIFMYTPIHEFKKLIKSRHFQTLFRLYQIDPFRTVHQSVSRFFSDPRLIQLFDRYATYNGSDPFQAPATLNIIPYIEYVLGGFYIKGGIYRLIDALVSVANELDVQIHRSSTVEKICHDGKRIMGVQVNGEIIKTEYVLCNTDAVIAHRELIDGYRSISKKLSRLEPSLSGMVFLWGVNGSYPELAHHNIIFSSDYRTEFEQIFKYQHVPDDPTIYIAITSKTDIEHAPEGCENWFVLLNMPYLIPEQIWDQEKDRMRSVVKDKLRQVGLNIDKHIEMEKIYTPVDFQDMYASNRGSIYGISSNSRTTAFKRIPNRSRILDGLYFSGGSVHPGGGIPLVVLSGKMAATLIAEDFGLCE